MPSTYPRWRRFAEINPDTEVVLIAPRYYEDRTWPEVRIFETEPVNEGKFRVIPIDMRRKRFTRNGFLSWELLQILRREKPDFLYMIGYEVDNIIMQLAATRFFWDRGCRKVAFTMRGLPFPLFSRHYRLRWSVSKKFFDAICCHYPHAVDIIRQQGGYRGRIFMQTQIGVDKNVHYFSEERRKNARSKFGISASEFIFGIACRIEDSKGVFEVLDALPEREDYRLLVLGDGIHKKEFLEKIREKGLENRIVFPGFVSMGEGVAEALCAMDAFIHFPKTTSHWIDTFPLAVVQAMATRLPVIGSDSGAVPYQIGNKDLIVPEGNAEALRNKLLYLLENPDKVRHLGNEAYERVLKTFEIEHLTRSFSCVVEDIISRREVSGHEDQANFQF